MPVLANPNHEKFAQYVAKGMTGAEAYRKLGRKVKAGTSDRAIASRLLAQVTVRGRVTEIQQQAADGTVLSMRERREFLARVVRVKIAEIEDKGENADLIQELTYTRTETENGTSVTRKIKIPDKRACLMDDAKLAGDLIEKDSTQLDEGGLLRLLSGIGNWIKLPGEKPGKVIDVEAERLELDAGVEHVDEL